MIKKIIVGKFLYITPDVHKKNVIAQSKSKALPSSFKKKNTRKQEKKITSRRDFFYRMKWFLCRDVTFVHKKIRIRITKMFIHIYTQNYMRDLVTAFACDKKKLVWGSWRPWEKNSETIFPGLIFCWKCDDEIKCNTHFINLTTKWKIYQTFFSHPRCANENLGQNICAH